jgi:hypothetical protein
MSIYSICFQDECNHHHADTDNVARRGTDATGIGSIACARNGIFCPGSTVDFVAGEQSVTGS